MQNYLGNYFTMPELQHDIDHAQFSHQVIEVELTQVDQKKSRIYAKTQSGDAIGLLKQRDWQLTHGDVFQLTDEGFLLIHLNAQPLMTLSLGDHQQFDAHSVDALKLIHLGHTLGNHHYPIVVTADKIYIQINENVATLESIIKAFDITGLKIGYETQSSDQTLMFTSHQHV